MRKVSFAVVTGFLLCTACGGEEKPPETPTPPAPPPAVTPATTAEAPKEEPKPKETLAQMEEKAVRGYFDAMNARDAKKLASLYGESASVKVAGAPADATGREAIAASFQKLFDAYPDFKTGPTRVWMKDDVVIVEWAFNGTHQGDLWGIKGTEKKAGCQAVDAMWFSPDGKIKEQHVYYDGGTILSQIGVSKQKARAIPALPSGPPKGFTSKGSPDEAKNVEALKAMNGAFEAKKEADFLAAITDTTEFDDMTQPQTMKGKADAKKFFKEVMGAFPDSKMTTTNTWAFDDTVVSEMTWTGTNQGKFFGMPATKKPITVKSIDITQFKDGKIVHSWTYSNGADFLQQLGVMPQPKKPADKPAAGAPADKKPADKPAEKK